MTALELLSPARNADIGIAAIDCGADAVYIAAERFGARKDAGNPLSEVERLCAYAHLFGVKIYLTVNTILSDEEMPQVHEMMLRAQEAGVDAFIIRDMRICGWDDIKVPLHASTQCAIRDVETARACEQAGCSRIILERQLSLEQIRTICSAVDCEVECFVHGAICTGYSGECRLSEYLSGRSADRGECIQACRSLYDLEDAEGRILVRNKALLSLKDYNLRNRLEELADAGVSSFKIEGRLKNISYVKNVVRDYSLALDGIIARRPTEFVRASYGTVSGGFTPDSRKTFNRGYTELYIDGRHGKWSSMYAPKSMGERIGTVDGIAPAGSGSDIVTVTLKDGAVLHNGDGFAFVTRDGITGFRGDVCSGREIRCRHIPDLREGAVLYRNINSAFERELETNMCRRAVGVKVALSVSDSFWIEAVATSEDGREARIGRDAGSETALNRDRMREMLKGQMSKRQDQYDFSLDSLRVLTGDGALPLMSASFINSIRRDLASGLDALPFNARPLGMGKRDADAPGLPWRIVPDDTLMRSRYCIRYELGMCPTRQGAPESGPLFLLNNGRKLAIHFDCGRCEMSVLSLIASSTYS